MLSDSGSLALKNSDAQRETYWSEGIAVGSKNYINTVQTELGIRASGTAMFA